MANQTPVSSLIGANLNATGSTALFALGTVCNTDDGGRYEYVEATATYTTGEFVLINAAGTAEVLTTAKLTAFSAGYDIGVFQGVISQGEFGWVAKQGRNLFIYCTGTVTAGNPTGLGFSAAAGRVELGSLVGVGNTAFGVFVNSSVATTGGTNVTLGTLTWPSSAIKQ